MAFKKIDAATARQRAQVVERTSKHRQTLLDFMEYGEEAAELDLSDVTTRKGEPMSPQSAGSGLNQALKKYNDVHPDDQLPIEVRTKPDAVYLIRTDLTEAEEIPDEDAA